MLQWNILQYSTKILRQYSNCNEILEIFPTCFCNILCYVGISPKSLIAFPIMFPTVSSFPIPYNCNNQLVSIVTNPDFWDVRIYELTVGSIELCIIHHKYVLHGYVGELLWSYTLVTFRLSFLVSRQVYQR